MPEQIARKIPGRTPIFTHHHLPQSEALALMERIAGLGGRASPHLIAMQSFRLQLARITDADSTVRLLEVREEVLSRRRWRRQLESHGWQASAINWRTRWLSNPWILASMVFERARFSCILPCRKGQLREMEAGSIAPGLSCGTISMCYTKHDKVHAHLDDGRGASRLFRHWSRENSS
jgi:hypothetical protein